MEIHHEYLLGVMCFVFEFDMLVQRTLGAVGFVAFVYAANVVPSYLDRSATHSLPAFGWVFGNRLVGHLVAPPPLSNLDP